MSEGEFAAIIDKRLLVVMMVRSNLEPFKPLLSEEKKITHRGICMYLFTSSHFKDEEIRWEL